MTCVWPVHKTLTECLDEEDPYVYKKRPVKVSCSENRKSPNDPKIPRFYKGTAVPVYIPCVTLRSKFPSVLFYDYPFPPKNSSNWAQR